MNLTRKINVTAVCLPRLKELTPYLEDMWGSGIVTNMGKYHNILEGKLKEKLDVKSCLLFNSGTSAIYSAINSLNLPEGSEVITTPFTFASTIHCIKANGLSPVFCDIEKETFCIDHSKIEEKITSKTKAILAVHVYGFPCAVHEISEIAKRHNLKIVYDAAHAFGLHLKCGRSISQFGDLSAFSFHATKLFNTIEGGCVTFNSDNDSIEENLRSLRNFGIRDEDRISGFGLNGKLNEISSAIGILNLEIYEDEVSKRKKVKSHYLRRLSGIDHIQIPSVELLNESLQYFPILIKADGKFDRDFFHKKLKSSNIYSRKYFYPLCSDIDIYSKLPSSQKENLPVANIIKNQVLCLPFYGDLDYQVIEIICDILSER